jgi:hypothetical protein
MKKQQKDKNLVERIQAPTPTFFKRIRNMGLAMGAIGAALLSAPITLPAAIISVAGYMATAGLVASAISQVVYQDQPPGE